MRICRKCVIDTVFFAVLAICLSANLSFAHGKTVFENSISGKTIRLSHSSVIGGVPDCEFPHKCGKNKQSHIKIFFGTLRMAFDGDWISKIISLNHAARLTISPLGLAGRFLAMLSGLAPSQGFHLSFSGLSPPSL